MVDVSRYVWLLSMKFSYYDIPSLVAIPVVGIGIFNTPWIFYPFGIFDHLEYFTLNLNSNVSKIIVFFLN